MNNLKIFNNTEFGQVRMIEENGQIWFCGADVASALGFKDTVNALKQHCREDGVVKRHLIDSMGRQQEAKFINEPNLYRLIIHSKLPSAERFEKWVFEEVLPAIRKTGKYEMVPTNPLPKAQSVSEAVNLGKFVRDLLKDQGASPYQMADILLDTMKQFGVSLSDKLLLPVKLDKVREDELDMVEFKFAFPESTWQDYMTYRTLLKVSR